MSEKSNDERLDDLVRKAASGCETSLNELIRELQPIVERTVFGRLAHGDRRTDAEGLVNSTLAEINADFRRSPTRSFAELRTRTIRRTTDRVTDVMRAIGRWREQTLDESAITRARRAPTHAVTRKDATDLLIEKVERSQGPAWAEVVRLKLDGMSVPEIARHVGKSERAIRRYMAELKKTLGSWLRRQLP